MNRVIEWKSIIDEYNGIKTRQSKIRSYWDCVPKNKTYTQNYSNDVITIMFSSLDNQRGFRQLSVIVTTSYVGLYAYKELIKNEQTIAIIADNNLLELLQKYEQINNFEALKTTYPKERKDGEVI